MKKIKKISKKVSRKLANTHAKPQKLIIQVQPIAAIVPTANDLAEPMTEVKGKKVKLTIPKTWVSEGQLNKILQVTPKQHVYQKPGKGGGTFDYVTTAYVTKALNYIFGWNWDFDVLEHGIEGGQVWVKAKLTVRGTKAGETITKTQFGRNDIKMKKTGGMLDFGNDMKGAASDALKKCASMLGIASDIYGKADFKSESGKDVVQHPVLPVPKASESQEVEMKKGQIIGPDGYPTWACEKCGDPIGEQVADYSLKVYGKRLCREDQPAKK